MVIMSRRSKRTQSLIQLALLAGILLFINVLGNVIYGKIDLTEDKRYTLTDATKEMLHNLDEPVYVRVLLEGKFPAGFKRLRRATEEILIDIRGESKSFNSSNDGFFASLSNYFSKDAQIEYEFLNPNEGSNEVVKQRITELIKDGLQPTRFRVKDTEGTSESILFPYAVFYYKGRRVNVQLLEPETGLGQEEAINNSINALEYKFANAIQKLQLENKPIIAFTSGHGELDDLETKDFMTSMRSFYEFGRFNLDSAYQVPQDIDLLIIAKPKTPFSEEHKFLLDQYVMNGGKILWLVDKLNATLDSMRTDAFFVPRDYPTNLDDILFKYGVRVEPNLVLDLQCSKIPQVIGTQGGRPQIELFDWYYHPVSVPQTDHPVVKGLDNVNLYFPSRIDTVRTQTPVKKTVLLSSSNYSREQYAPMRLSFDILRFDPVPEQYKKQYLPFAVLLEGTFPSLYEKRVTETMRDALDQMGTPFRSQSVENRMIVVSDGDIMRNEISNPETRAVFPLGYNRYDRKQYSNKDFLINAVEYLLDDRGVIEARGKDVQLRLLDTVRANDERVKWGLINIGIPLFLLVVFGLIFNWMRKRRYGV
jgi:ABC-2 type transport system permease protein